MTATPQKRTRNGRPINVIKEVEPGQRVLMRLLVREVDRRETTTGKPYLDLLLSDSTGEIVGKRWDATNKDEEQLNPNAIIAVKGRIDEFNNALQLNILDYKVLKGYEPIQFIARSPYDVRHMWQDLMKILGTIKHPGLKELNKRLLEDDEIQQRIKVWGAANRNHHCYAEGYLEHVYRIVKNVSMNARLYPEVDYDLVVTAAMWHDVGKLWCYSAPPLLERLRKEELIGHTVWGAIKIYECGKDILDEKTMDLLLHCIISHHGRPEWGAPVEPMIDEAKLIHAADYADAQIGRGEQLRRQHAGGEARLDREHYYVPRESISRGPDGNLVQFKTEEKDDEN